MNVLAVVHGPGCPLGSFGEVVEKHGHLLDTWSPESGSPAPGRLDDYGAVLIFGGSMHADQEEQHPWLREEDAFIRRLLDLGVPTLGVCLGAQLVAKAADARVYPLDEPERGWAEVELTDEAARDPVFAALPTRFPAFEWHYYAFDVPASGVELGRSRACPQAFRLGEPAWAVQFHPEVTRTIVARWVEGTAEPVSGSFLAESEERIDEWVRFGRALCGAFVTAAERILVAA